MKVVFLVLSLVFSIFFISGCNLNQEPIVIPGNHLPELNESQTNISNEIVLNSSGNITDLNLSIIVLYNISELNISNITSNYTSNQTNITS